MPKETKETPSIPVEVAAKIARELIFRALSSDEFRTDKGYTKWGLVEQQFEIEMLEAANGETMIWNGEHQPAYERKLLKINNAFHKWPEPARKECCDILANG